MIFLPGKNLGLKLNDEREKIIETFRKSKKKLSRNKQPKMNAESESQKLIESIYPKKYIFVAEND